MDDLFSGGDRLRGTIESRFVPDGDASATLHDLHVDGD